MSGVMSNVLIVSYHHIINKKMNIIFAYMVRTDKVREVVAIGEAAGGATGGIVDAIGRRVGACGGRQVIVVATVNQRVPEHKESASTFNTLCVDEKCHHHQGEDHEDHSHS